MLFQPGAQVTLPSGNQVEIVRLHRGGVLCRLVAVAMPAFKVGDPITLSPDYLYRAMCAQPEAPSAT